MNFPWPLAPGPLRVWHNCRMSFHRKYFSIFILLLLLEVCIAVFAKDPVIRPFVGDVLVVLLLFALIRTFHAGGGNAGLAVGVALFACLVELGQYFNLLARLNLQDSQIAGIILGSTFDWKDILAYLLGAGLSLVGSEKIDSHPGAATKE